MSRQMTTLEAQIEQAHTGTIPAFTYYDPEVYQLELEHLFARSWHLAGPEHKVAKPRELEVVF